MQVLDSLPQRPRICGQIATILATGTTELRGRRQEDFFTFINLAKDSLIITRSFFSTLTDHKAC